MEYYCIDNYYSFQCLAGECPSTCCAGWNIFVDTQDYLRFAQLRQSDLREDILSHIRQSHGKYYFLNRADGRCAMLDDDGLCRIQRNSSEEMLCNTCRKYPRLFHQRQGVYYLSMAASCPVIARALWQGEVSYSHVESGRICRIEGWRMPVSQPVWDYFISMRERASVYGDKLAREELFWDSMGNLFDMLAACLSDISVGERREWERLLLFYSRIPEEGAEGKLAEFFSREEQKWMRFTGTYLMYRFMGLQTMYDETCEETFCQSMGEVFLVQASCFLEFCRQGVLSDGLVCAWMQRMYRLCANSKKCRERIKQGFLELYREKSLWCYLLPVEGDGVQEK